MSLMKHIAARGIIAIAVLLLFFGCLVGDIAAVIKDESPAEIIDSSAGSDAESADDSDAIKYNPPVLKTTEIKYLEQKGALPQIAVIFSFNMAVAVAGQTPGSSVTGDGGNTLTLSPAMAGITPGAELSISLTAANTNDPTKTRSVSLTVMPVSGFLSRPATDTKYTITDGTSYGAFRLRTPGALTEDWYYVQDDSARALFSAAYTPNAPDSRDAVESGKEAVPYTQAISQAVLGLFKITLGPAASADRIEISGTELPNPPGADKYHPLVIDLGVPGGAANHRLPVFRIPAGGLGVEPSGGYTHLRLRVNRDTKLVIEADNSNYTTWTDSPFQYGKLKKATVEVMGGGSLRDGAYKGAALGEDSLIIARLNSCLALGPENSSDIYYKGYFVGPSQSDARILWDPGDQNGSFIEIRGEDLAFDTHLTVQKSVALTYNLWFVNGPRLTIRATDTLDGQKGLFPRDPGAGRKLYGTYYDRGGQNTATIRAAIIVSNGSAIAGSLWTNTPGQAPEGSRTLLNYGEETAIPKKEYTSSTGQVPGYFNWGGA
jgi:hypothetical protein